MPDLQDLRLLIQSHTPLIIVESHEESRAVDLFHRLAAETGSLLWKWTVTSGLRRLATGYSAQKFNTAPNDVLRNIRSTTKPGIYLLLDFHPYLNDPVNIRLVREIGQAHHQVPHHLVFLSPTFDIPPELRSLSARYQLTLPDKRQIVDILRQEANAWNEQNGGSRVKADAKAIQLLARNLAGLTASDVRRLAKKAIFDDGAITLEDAQMVMEAKYELLSDTGVLSFEYETEAFANVGGLNNLKTWLFQRRAVFEGKGRQYGLEDPKGVLLLGVQGCGKSLAAKSVAGVWNVPLLRLDFGELYNKYIGETEKNLRDSLNTAEIMAPCVLWIDEIEKGLSGGDGDDGVSRRVLGTLLTWMAERKRPVFLVATANDVTSLPPELLRKGRFDEIFFVDLPDIATRRDIFQIQFQKRRLQAADFEVHSLAEASDGFSGAEIEQAVVSAIYAALAQDQAVDTAILLAEIGKTRPLSVLMAEKIAALRRWAKPRTVPAN